MIAYLEGTILKKLPQHVIVLTQGVGYLVCVGNERLSELQEGKAAALSIHTQVKEDGISLFGFRHASELHFFQQLISVSGIGAKTAMAIMNMPIEVTQRALVSEDITTLSSIPGLGKKTAARLVLELKGKIELQHLAQESGLSAPRALHEEALQALVSLGYDKPTIIRFLNEHPKSYESAEEVVRAFLQKA